MTNERTMPTAREERPQSGHLHEAPPGSPPPWGGLSTFRLDFWFSSDGQVVQWNLVGWDRDAELETILVTPIGPFDDPPRLDLCLSEALGELLRRGVQLRLF